MSTPRPHGPLAVVELRTVRRLARTVRVSGAELAAPLVQPVPALPERLRHRPIPAGHDLFGVWFAFDLEPPPARSRFTGVFLRVCFDDRRVTVLGLATSSEQPGTAAPGARSRRGGLPVSAEELDGPTAGLFFGDAGHAPAHTGDPATGGYAVHAVVSVPVDLPDLTGTLRVDASVARGARRRRIEHLHGHVPAPFTLRLPGERTPAVPGTPRSAPDPDAGVRLCFAADIERFSRFRTPEAARAQRRFVDLLAAARRHAGVEGPQADLQKSGDGQFEVFPASLDEAVVIPRLVEGLLDALARTNADLSAHARLRIRAALHRGHVRQGVNGWIGESAIAVHRLLDSDRLRRELAGHPEADLALIVSDTLFRDVIAHGYGRLVPDDFHRVAVRIPAKGFDEHGWIYVPGPR